jgi:hypothetical protein
LKKKMGKNGALKNCVMFQLNSWVVLYAFVVILWLVY